MPLEGSSSSPPNAFGPTLGASSCAPNVALPQTPKTCRAALLLRTLPAPRWATATVNLPLVLPLPTPPERSVLDLDVAGSLTYFPAGVRGSTKQISLATSALGSVGLPSLGDAPFFQVFYHTRKILTRSKQLSIAPFYFGRTNNKLNVP